MIPLPGKDLFRPCNRTVIDDQRRDITSVQIDQIKRGIRRILQCRLRLHDEGILPVNSRRICRPGRAHQHRRHVQTEPGAEHGHVFSAFPGFVFQPVSCIHLFSLRLAYHVAKSMEQWLQSCFDHVPYRSRVKHRRHPQFKHGHKPRPNHGCHLIQSGPYAITVSVLQTDLRGMS